jgi:NAD(P)-dependent dehydrogenase (short-subunit alcohol dehydrogenase family)
MSVLAEKVAVIAGATSGIGACTAEVFAAEGAKVVIAGRRQDEGDALSRTLAATFVRTDVSVERDVEALIAHTMAIFGRLDVFVNSAGEPGAGGSVVDMDLTPFQRTLAVHAGGVLLGTKYAARAMLDHESGSIINITSIAGKLAGWAGLGYSAAKAAAVQITRCAAIELGDRGIRVNSISAGPILTGIFGKGAGMDAAEADRTASDLESVFLAALKSHQPIRRAGLPKYVAQAALWLASDASSFVTGHDLIVDGGISAGRPAAVAAAERAELAKAFSAITT